MLRLLPAVINHKHFVRAACHRSTLALSDKLQLLDHGGGMLSEAFLRAAAVQIGMATFLRAHKDTESHFELLILPLKTSLPSQGLLYLVGRYQ